MDFLLIYIMSIQRIMKRLKYTRYIYANSLAMMGSGILKYLMDARTTTVFGSIYILLRINRID